MSARAMRKAYAEGYNAAMDQFCPSGPRLVPDERAADDPDDEWMLMVSMAEAILAAQALKLDRLATDLSMYRAAAQVTLRSRG